jgi:hypothetical protein
MMMRLEQGATIPFPDGAKDIDTKEDYELLKTEK